MVPGGGMLRWETVRTLGRMGPVAASALPRLRATDAEREAGAGDFIEDRIAELLIEGSAGTREEAILALAKHRNWRVRRAAATEMGRDEASDRWVRELVQLLADGSDFVRVTAAESLLKRGREREACHQALLAPAPASEWSHALDQVWIMWRYKLDPSPVLPQLQADLARATNPTVQQNYSRMISDIQAGRSYPNGW